jgi:hypothetical protein
LWFPPLILHFVFRIWCRIGLRLRVSVGFCQGTHPPFCIFLLCPG